MENYLTYLLQNFSLEIFLMSVIVFVLTLIIKIPIKKATSKLYESKRSAINSVIVLIPLLLAFLSSLIYFLILKREILTLDFVSCSLSVCVMAISLHLVISRTTKIIRGVMSGKIKAEDAIQEVSDIVEDACKNSKVNDTSQNSLDKIKRDIDILLGYKEELEKLGKETSITILTEIDNEIKKLESEEKTLKTTN